MQICSYVNFLLHRVVKLHFILFRFPLLRPHLVVLAAA